MKITFIMFANVLNGGNRVIGIVAAELAARGHDVQIITQPHPKPSVRRILSSVVQHGRLPPKPVDGPFLDAIIKSDGLTTLRTPRPVRDSDVADGDIVIASWWETAPWVNALSARKGAKVYFMQDYGAVGQEIEKLIPTWQMPFTFVTLNSQLQAMIKAQNPSASVAIMRNAVDHSVFKAAPRARNIRPTIGLIHRNQPTKGMDIAAQALTEIRKGIPDLRAIAVGASTSTLPDWVELVHRPDDQALAQVYRSCDLWLFPSRMEGFGLPIIEAMASHTPVISTRVGGAEDVITDGASGYLVEIDDWRSMSQRATALLTGPETHWSDMSKAAHDAVASHTWSDAVDIFEAALVEAHAAHCAT